MPLLLGTQSEDADPDSICFVGCTNFLGEQIGK